MKNNFYFDEKVARQKRPTFREREIQLIDRIYPVLSELSKICMAFEYSIRINVNGGKFVYISDSQQSIIDKMPENIILDRDEEWLKAIGENEKDVFNKKTHNSDRICGRNQLRKEIKNKMGVKNEQ